ncbi:von Willebrand factor type A domain-containing protein [Planomicrobium soli]|uniref:von Willebrand factor type A domain-containing protein n=1 Tax=Planomicrobium soli TaxID=1176648 RepID=A0A2P8G162_9BACL|nr:BatA and WFA domain-containing protein [Planomicrobium soli]PSL27708.1 von Willebrand factor type A domain-containing protein [Planomicrobium soli]
MSFSGWGYVWTAVMPLAVLLYYFFRKKYKDQHVASTMFWQELMKEIKASPYLKKLQHHILLYLQLAALLICVFALLGPHLTSEALEGNEFIFVVDTSATMLAGEPAAFELQQELMKEMATQTGGKPVTIVTTGANPEIVLRKEPNREALETAIDRLAVTYENAKIEQTILFAETLIDDESTVIHVFTDALDRSILANKAGMAYEIHGIDQPLQNVSMRQFGLAKTEDGIRAIVQLVNETAEPVSGKVILTDGEVEKTANIQLEAEEELLVPFEQLPDSPVWQAVLQVKDDYTADNSMAAFVQEASTRVAVDSSLHELVGAGFRSLNVEVDLMDPMQLRKAGGSPLVTNQTDLLAGQMPILLIGRNDEKTHRVAGAIETVPHALFTYAPFDGIYISEIYPPFEEYETIATIDGEPLIQLSPEGDIAVLTDIQLTDWPLHPSFPLFLWSAIGELSGTDNFFGFFQPNEQRAVALASTRGEWEIYKDGEFFYSYIEGQGAFSAPQEPGIYEVVGEGKTLKMIVQLSNEEKTLVQGTSYRIGQAEETAETAELSIVPWLLFAVVFLLLVEWEVYRRGNAHR